jgi:hypothetical protein
MSWSVTVAVERARCGRCRSRSPPRATPLRAHSRRTSSCVCVCVCVCIASAEAVCLRRGRRVRAVAGSRASRARAGSHGATAPQAMPRPCRLPSHGVPKAAHRRIVARRGVEGRRHNVHCRRPPRRRWEPCVVTAGRPPELGPETVRSAHTLPWQASTTESQAAWALQLFARCDRTLHRPCSRPRPPETQLHLASVLGGPAIRNHVTQSGARCPARGMATVKTHRNRHSGSGSTCDGSWKLTHGHEPVASVPVHGHCLTCSSLPRTHHLHSVHKVPFLH